MGDGRPSVWRQQIFHLVVVFRGKRPVLGQILAGSLLEPDFGNLAASGPASKTAFWDYWETARFGSNPGREPFGAKFWQFGGFRAAIKTAFWDYWETARFGPNPGREPFGAKFWQFGGFWAASKTAFWDYWETARFGPNPGRLLEPDFGNLAASGPQVKPPSGTIGSRFGPNPGREPFGAKFWQFGGFRAAIKTAFWDYWETARFGPNPGREPFGAGFWQFGGF